MYRLHWVIYIKADHHKEHGVAINEIFDIIPLKTKKKSGYDNLPEN
jgi:hypothetical protein